MVYKKLIILLTLLGLALHAGAQQDPVKRKPRVIQDNQQNPLPNSQTQTQQTNTQTPQGRGKGSQIVDDSTKNVYGPKTTLWITEEDVFRNKNIYQPLDTSLNNYHRWTYVQKYANHYQDLGNVGTALNPIFPTVSDQIGASPGFLVYNPYFGSEAPKYFDTKSPYTSIKLVWGADGRALSKIEYSRNVNPRWNFGFNYRPLLVDKQIQRTGKGDRQTVSHYYDLYSSYKSINEKYLLLANYRRIRHRVNENGGIFLLTESTTDDFFADDVRPYLLAAQTQELRNQLHFFHQYQLAKPFQVYHTLDITRQINRFVDTKGSETNYDDYFKFTLNDLTVETESVSDDVEFKTFVNEAGIKGNAAFLFYNVYYKLRSYSTFNKYINEKTLPFNNDGLEHYLGGKVALRFDSLSELSGNAEYLLDGNYRLAGELKTPWLDARIISALAKPSFLSLAYKGSHNSWENDFSNTFSNQLAAFLKVRWKGFFISPGATYSLFNKYIFYKENDKTGEQTVLPFQSSGNQQVFAPEVKMSLKFFRHFNLRPHIVYTSLLTNDDNALQIPQWFSNIQLAYENVVFKGNLNTQIGVDFHWRSAYSPMGYDPAIQQYYLQRSFTNQAFPLVDIFFNGQFKRGKFFVKYHNLNQAITQRGYLLTPNYRIQPNVIDFGFDLILFD